MRSLKLHRGLTVTLTVASWLTVARAQEGPATREAMTAADLPVGSAPTAITFDHFPDRLHAYVWRNWNLIPLDRLAAVVKATPEQLERLARRMHLPPSLAVSPEVERSLHITIIRRNWHLVPYEQLLALLETTPEALAFALREDDFLFVKLGNLKPRCEELRYDEPGPEAIARAEAIGATVTRHLGSAWNDPGQPPFAFLETLAAAPADSVSAPAARPGDEKPRFLYSYFGAFGDPLAGGGLDPYPDGLLSRLAAQGVNGVWLHVLLRNLAPGGPDFPDFGAGSEERLAALERLVARAGKRGIKVYLYLNEPRALPVASFAGREGTRGVAEGEYAAMCSSDPSVRAWLTAATRHVFTRVRGLGGIFTITASENLTHCASHGRERDCPRCGPRGDVAVIAEVIAAIEAGVHAAAPGARVIAWDWGWRGHGDGTPIIAALPEGVALMSVSEWSLPIERGGVRSEVGEYCLSAVGPGPRAQRHWKAARDRGLPAFAKLQLNATWELSAVPFLPVLDLVAEHCANLAGLEIDGFMLSWTLGGYPSPNLGVAREFARDPGARAGDVLDRIARERYGPEAAPSVRRAWTAFSRAFREYPYSGTVVYSGPQQLGPANLLFARKTGYAATMVGFPYDDLDGWRAPYPADVFGAQFRKVADGWSAGIETFEQACALARSEGDRRLLEDDLRIARAAGLHLASVANQAEFVRLRDQMAQARDNPGALAADRARLLEILNAETALASELFTIARQDSRIGFEASNQYYYLPQDLVEKIINCEHLKSAVGDSAPGR